MEGVIQIKRLQLLYSTLINQWLLLLIENLVYGNLFLFIEKKLSQTTKIKMTQLSTVDLLARVSMKNVAKCDK